MVVFPPRLRGFLGRASSMSGSTASGLAGARRQRDAARDGRRPAVLARGLLAALRHEARGVPTPARRPPAQRPAHAVAPLRRRHLACAGGEESRTEVRAPQELKKKGGELYEPSKEQTIARATHQKDMFSEDLASLVQGILENGVLHGSVDRKQTRRDRQDAK